MARKKLKDVDTQALSELAETFPSTAPKKKKPPKKEADVTVTLRLPPRIYKALRVKAAAEDKTQRELILMGLKAVGLDIKDEDITDRRRH